MSLDQPVSLDQLVSVPFGATLAVVTLISVATMQVLSVDGRVPSRRWRRIPLALASVLIIVIVARFVRFV